MENQPQGSIVMSELFTNLNIDIKHWEEAHKELGEQLPNLTTFEEETNLVIELLTPIECALTNVFLRQTIVKMNRDMQDILATAIFEELPKNNIIQS